VHEDRSGRVTVRELSKRFGAVQAVDGLTFSVEPGAVTGFLGPNGSGKTTTLRMILGLVAPTAGEARINGLRFAELPHPARVVGAVLEAQGFHPARTARAHLLACAAAIGVPDSAVEHALGTVGLGDAGGRPVGEYSLGMRQRLALAVALLGDPQVLVLDEPGNGLDPAGLKWLRDTLRALAHDQGKTVMLSSHILSEVQETVDVAVVIAEGALVSEFSLAEADAGERVVIARATKAAELETAIARDDDVRVSRDGDRLRVTGLSASRVGDIALETGVALSELEAEHRSLEDRYMELTQGKGR
jgi:ABC-2 type transport system ATP-binding protein